MSREEVLLEIARLIQVEEPRFTLMGGPRIVKELWALIGNSGGTAKPTTPTSETLCEHVVRRRANNMQAFINASAAQLEAIAPRLRKVGRPKIYPDRKTQMRELMRRKRAVHRFIKKRP